jgi:hypothetical protein
MQWPKDPKGVIKTVNWRWTENIVAKRYQRSNQRFTVLITPLVLFDYSVVCPSSIYRFDYPFGIFWPLYFLSIFNLPFWLPLWYLLATLLSVHLQFTVLITQLASFGHSIFCPSLIYRFDYPFGIFWRLYCLSIFNLPFLLPICYLLATLLSVHLQFTVFITPLVSVGQRPTDTKGVIKTVNCRWTDNRVAKR